MKRILFCLYLLASNLLLQAQTAVAPAGTGTAADPYQIATLANLHWLARTSSEWVAEKYFIQTANIDASSTSTWYSGAGLPRIGNGSVVFKGNYDGQNYIISNLTINLPGQLYVGLFGFTGLWATIKNIGLQDVNVKGANNTGGLIGFSYGATISNCYCTGTVSGARYVGGLIGTENNAIISNCYSTARVSGTADLGGLIGLKINNYSSTTNCFYDTSTSLQSDNTGKGTPKTTAEMKNQATFTGATWDFLDENNNGTAEIWKIETCINNGYPIFNKANAYPTEATVSATAPSLGDGSAANPYQISTLAHLYWLSRTPSVWDKNFIQTANIEASATSTWHCGQGFSPIGNISIKFKGSYNGQNYSISNLRINRPSKNRIGLFGEIFAAQITNIALPGVNIRGGNAVGALVGTSNGNWLIENSYCSGLIIGGSSVGGLVGQSVAGSSINKCFSFGTVRGANNTGGLIGITDGVDITNCYSSSTVIGTNYQGGLIGRKYSGTVSNSYSIGAVTGATNLGGLIGSNSGLVTNCFYDTNSSGRNDTGKGTPKTTADMKTQATFTGASWDFLGETTNGTADIWKMESCINGGYPIFNSANVYPTEATVSATAPTLGDGSAANPYQISTLAHLYWLSRTPSVWNKNFIQTANINASTSSTWHCNQGFSPIGNTSIPFTGNYNGQNNQITGLTINRPNQVSVGLFGISTGNISNLGISTCSIRGNTSTGALVGQASGNSITNCFSSGSVSGGTNVGGLIGVFQANAVTQCYSSCSVTGLGNNVGGLIGYTSVGNITKSYATGVVTGGSNVGGLIGDADNMVSLTITNCYSLGNVASSAGGGLIGRINGGTSVTNCYAKGSAPTGGLIGLRMTGSVSNCFYDTNTSGRNDTGKGTPKTTVEMKTQATFTGATWDFLGETTNGTADIWKMEPCINGGYPSFAYQITASPIYFTSQPSNVSICTGSAATFTSTAVGAGLSTQWYKVGTGAISGATNPSYTINPTNLSDAGDYYAEITNASGCKLSSNTVSLFMSSAPTSNPNALHFDGTDDYVDLGTLNTTNNFSQGFSYCGWVKWNAFKAGSKLIDISNGASNDNICIGNVGTTSKLYMHSFNNNTISTLNSTSNVPLNTWTHISLTISGNTAKIYINGILDKSGTVQLPRSVARTISCLGKGSWPGDGKFSGEMDEVSIWDKELSACDIKRLMKSSPASTELGLVRYFDFNQGIPSGDNTCMNRIADKSANATNAALLGFAMNGTNSNMLASTVPTNVTNLIATQPSDVEECEGENTSLSVSAKLSGVSYQWRKNGLEISGATLDSYSLSSLSSSDAGNYDVILSYANNCSDTSLIANLSLKPVPTISVADGYVCGFGSASFFASSDISGSSFEWYNAATGGTAICNTAAFNTPDIDTTTVYYISATANGCTTLSRKEAKALVAPDSCYWIGAASSDWNDDANWSPSKPGSCSDIFIKTATNYPDISSLGTVSIHNIFFEPEASIFGLENLDYNRANVQLELQRNKWYMLSAPLKEMYSGDYYYEGAPVTSMKLFGFNYTASTGTNIKTVSGRWSNSFASLSEKLSPTEGFAYKIESTEWHYPSGYSSLSTDKRVTFPRTNTDGSLKETAIPYSGVTGKLYSTLAQSMPKDASNAYRFAMEDASGTLNSISIPVDTGYNLIGNPLMSHLDFKLLYAHNSSLLENYIQFWDGSTFNSIDISGTANIPSGISTVIPPMKSFVIRSKEKGNLIINTTDFVPTGEIKLKAASVKENSMYIQTIENESISSAAIMYNEQAKADIPKLFSQEASTNEIYCIKNKQCNNITNISKLPSIIPLGIKTTKTDSLLLRFIGAESYDGIAVNLINTSTNEIIDLKENNSYYYNAINNATEGTLFVEFRSASVITNNDEMGEDCAIQIYSDGNNAKIISSEQNKILAVYIYDALGKIIAQKTALNSNIETININHPGKIFVVKALTEQGLKTQKIIIK